jgi:hypothetical protein
MIKYIALFFLLIPSSLFADDLKRTIYSYQITITSFTQTQINTVLTWGMNHTPMGIKNTQLFDTNNEHYKLLNIMFMNQTQKNLADNLESQGKVRLLYKTDCNEYYDDKIGGTMREFSQTFVNDSTDNFKVHIST